ncbi:hypothetical protein TNCV_4201401 [Trichonephila clavipes]|uniref:Uncharacterized protein n=1 Tax=Trichonephila clavipes TaxID=2585209 RepID=A0A8X7BIN8_TRICX|nr:hypothetical protein TNCV_4201401 [Trichonephila clavipes]
MIVGSSGQGMVLSQVDRVPGGHVALLRGVIGVRLWRIVLRCGRNSSCSWPFSSVFSTDTPWSWDGCSLFQTPRITLSLWGDIAALGMNKHVNAVRFTSDGGRILASTTARRLAVIDVERGEQVMSYDNCGMIIGACLLEAFVSRTATVLQGSLSYDNLSKTWIRCLLRNITVAKFEVEGP